MIVTVTLNSALDVTYPVPALVLHGSHRVGEVHTRAGGKGVNVARTLTTARTPVLATGLLGGHTGALIRADLDDAGVSHHFVDIAAESRRTVNVVADDTGNATIFNERGPHVAEDEWATFLGAYTDIVADAELVVCSGSLPQGVSEKAYAELIEHAYGVPVVVDCSGPALLAAARAGAALVKPNLAEARSTTGITDPVAAGQALRSMGAGAVVVSQGADGLLALTTVGVWRAHAGEHLVGNPTGAGDACVAALARGYVRDLSWPQRLQSAVAWSAGAVVAPLAGDIDAAASERIAESIELTEIHATDINS